MEKYELTERFIVLIDASPFRGEIFVEICSFSPSSIDIPVEYLEMKFVFLFASSTRTCLLRFA